MIHLMKTLGLAVEIWLALFLACQAQESPTPAPFNPMVVPTGPNFVFQMPQPRYLTITCGEGHVSISLKDGSVEISPGCEIDAAAKNFWEALGKRMPKECKE